MEVEYKEFKDMVGGDSNIMSVNFAPINNNAQNWININTQVGMEVEIGGDDDCDDDCKGGKPGKPHHEKPGKPGHHGHGDEHYDDKHDEEGPDFEWENPMSWPEDMKYRVFMNLTKKFLSGAHDSAMHFKHELKPYEPLISQLVLNMTGKDCDEWMAIFEEKFLRGNNVADIA